MRKRNLSDLALFKTDCYRFQSNPCRQAVRTYTLYERKRIGILCVIEIWYYSPFS